RMHQAFVVEGKEEGEIPFFGDRAEPPLTAFAPTRPARGRDLARLLVRALLVVVANDVVQQRPGLHDLRDPVPLTQRWQSPPQAINTLFNLALGLRPV